MDEYSLYGMRSKDMKGNSQPPSLQERLQEQVAEQCFEWRKTINHNKKKATTNLDSILKNKDITLPTKVRLVKAMVFPVVLYGYESRTIKKAERRRIDAFELWCWRRLLRVPRTARRCNQSILEEIGPECSLEGWMLKLKLQYFGQLMWRADSFKRPWCWERLKAGEVSTEDEMVEWHHWLDGPEFKQALGVGDGQGGLACCDPWSCKKSDTTGKLN